MGILSRIVRLCRSDLHGVMDQLEDKHLLLKQYLREMEDDLKHKRARLVRMEQDGQDLRRDLENRRQALGKMEEDLRLAVARDKDDIARMLIRRRRTLEAGCAGLQDRLDRLQEARNRLSETVGQQTLQYEQLKARADILHRQSRQDRNRPPDGFADSDWPWPAPSDEEVELELLQRKEALAPGGES